ncbi:hypothetical protein M2451_000966 [Dysgonomonas sp. PFB1-18]|uniref:hypothetical protein n=1 Tax=unclassified Dysgonomonas TaxID=2630389 RepID=UPI002475A9B2|nr:MULTISPECIES: hypothetical protein [unclassified Dysgonomonas]MDH6308655.1 hypothetical protein [Dysgonomonas sp. PF1-14]MDH6338156.1 hypothetical protein [Dysgonomonas sp. PF1-16]MDH6379653.1 hypothetical protein [Dysgonomonas sp. PFB1-18]MDH6396983.1 hypothetical protein [Dysgonomonas sp. PF1-23]
MSKQHELAARWDTFLVKIKERFHEMSEQGKEAVLESLDNNNYDYYSSFRTLSSIKAQLQDSIINKIDKVWRDQVEPLMMADGDSYSIDKRHKGHNLRKQLSDEIHDWMFVCEGLLSEKYYQYAIQLVNKDFRCTQCNSPVQITKNLFQSHYVTCSYCNTVNSFVPETKYVQIGWNVVNNISAYSALAEWRAVYKLQQRTRNDDRDEYLEQYKEACRAYLKKYFEKRIELMPHTKETYEKDFAEALNKM